mmetsp:Transcript_7148/g.16314  ORF Transcript_7148/g.16314 Transcript_7148/m.16314 type:complete len:208 (-) Transcript_7148:99-722(-)
MRMSKAAVLSALALLIGACADSECSAKQPSGVAGGSALLAHKTVVREKLKVVEDDAHDSAAKSKEQKEVKAHTHTGEETGCAPFCTNYPANLACGPFAGSCGSCSVCAGQSATTPPTPAPTPTPPVAAAGCAAWCANLPTFVACGPNAASCGGCATCSSGAATTTTTTTTTTTAATGGCPSFCATLSSSVMCSPGFASTCGGCAACR